ncbi:hypothetical protein BC832DRAFT_554781 [Gaertneriomyces semiglobifer]|nr:hypothetical protein BC832DRAFT_554781 [Gaertneriomyces semiglobifer]
MELQSQDPLEVPLLKHAATGNGFAKVAHTLNGKAQHHRPNLVSRARKFSLGIIAMLTLFAVVAATTLYLGTLYNNEAQITSSPITSAHYDVTLSQEANDRLIVTVWDRMKKIPLRMHRLRPVHGRRMHVVAMNQQATYFAHVHPEDYVAGELQRDDIAQTELSLDISQGDYWVVMVELSILKEDGGEHTAEAVQAVFRVRFPNGRKDGSLSVHPSRHLPWPTGVSTLHLALVSSSAPDTWAHPIPISSSISSSDPGMYPYLLTLNMSSSIQRSPITVPVNECTALTTSFYAASSVNRMWNPITDLRPLLNSYAHITIISDDLSLVQHLHPEPSQGGERLSECGKVDHITWRHVAHEEDVPTLFGPTLTSVTTFPVAGWYTMIVQAAKGNLLLTGRFDILVG